MERSLYDDWVSGTRASRRRRGRTFNSMCMRDVNLLNG